MGDQSGSIRYRALFESALKTYEKETGITLVDHPLSVHLRTCENVEAISTLVQHQASALTGDELELQVKDRAMISIKNTVSILTKLFTIASLDYGIGLVCQKSPDDVSHISDVVSQPLPPPKAIYAGLAILFRVCALLYFGGCILMISILSDGQGDKYQL